MMASPGTIALENELRERVHAAKMHRSKSTNALIEELCAPRAADDEVKGTSHEGWSASMRLLVPPPPTHTCLASPAV